MKEKKLLWCLIAIFAVIILFGGKSTTHTIQAMTHSVPIASTPDNNSVTMSVLSQPKLTPDFYNQVLLTYHSPAAGQGQEIYDLGRQYGINSDIALAFFGHESLFGTQGVAATTHSPGNLRCIDDAACVGGYASFPTWQAGFEAWYKLIRDLYVNVWNLDTIDTIIPRYAPVANGNDDKAYLTALNEFLTSWYAGRIQA